MIDNLKKKKYNHMVLYHGSHNPLMNICENESKKQWINLPPQENKDLHE